MNVSAQGLALILKRTSERAPQIFARASLIAAQRARGALVRKSPSDQGIMRNAWKVIATSSGARVENNAPHAGIIEGGARPHPVSREGVAALTQWAIRKGYAADEKEAAPLVWSIVKKLKEKGQKGLFIVRDLVPEASKWLGEEFSAQLAADLSRP